MPTETFSFLLKRAAECLICLGIGWWFGALAVRSSPVLIAGSENTGPPNRAAPFAPGVQTSAIAPMVRPVPDSHALLASEHWIEVPAEMVRTCEAASMTACLTRAGLQRQKEVAGRAFDLAGLGAESSTAAAAVLKRVLDQWAQLRAAGAYKTGEGEWMLGSDIARLRTLNNRFDIDMAQAVGQQQAWLLRVILHRDLTVLLQDPQIKVRVSEGSVSINGSIGPGNAFSREDIERGSPLSLVLTAIERK